MRQHVTTNRFGIPCLAATAAALLFACGFDGEGAAGGAPASAPPGSGDGPGVSAPAPGGAVAPAPAPVCAVAPASGPLVVATSRGLVQGKKLGDISAFLGIPFASPPLGALRFAPPEQAACWDGVKKAIDFGAACPQTKTVGPGVEGEEDCLTINVWTPSLTPTKQAPVLMFMYGGANIMGSSNQAGVAGAMYDGQALANAQKAVVVTFNYRVGAFGFLTHPALAVGSAKGVSGNYGLQDAILALHWVQDNVGTFGGDKSKVMFFGESAGAFNTCALVTSPLAAGLFSSALMQSGSCGVPPTSRRYAQAQDFVKAVHCDTAADVAACLRAAPVADLVGATGSFNDLVAAKQSGPLDVTQVSDMSFGANVDGYVLPDAPLKTIAAGKANAVALVVGTNADEANIFLPPGTVTSCFDYDAKLQTAYGTRADAVRALYPCSALNPTKAYAQIMTDLVFACPSRRALRALATANKAPIYRYHFVHTYSYGSLAALGAFHVAEIPFVFGTFGGLGYVPTQYDQAFSATIQGYWARFAATQDPNGAGQPYWEKYVASRDNAATLTVNVGSKDGISTAACDYWDTLSGP